MCLFTHFAAGALAGGATGNVWLGAVAGLASHAVLDVIPHYDHPDWRLELGGGILSLILLLVMPFATAAAVVGGIFGMIPDLENLFQKLGRMKRSSFVFPTHTGLLPHGRELGPRSLPWQVAIFVGCFVALGFIRPAAAGAAEMAPAPVMGRPAVRLLEQGQDRSVVRVTFPAERPAADWSAVRPADVRWSLPVETDRSDPENPRLAYPAVPVALAVPTRRPVQTRVVDALWWREPDADPGLEGLVAFGAPAVYRGVPIAGTVVPVSVAGGILREVVLEIRHPAAGSAREQLALARRAGSGPDRPDPAVPAGILNRDLYLALARGGVEAARSRTVAKAAVPDPFALTDHWVRLEVTETGVFRVTGQDLLNFGVPTGDVDPAKIRVFRGGGLALDANPEVPDTLQPGRAFLNEIPVEVVGGGDGEWNLDDEVRFYGFGSSAWLDRFDPASPGDEFYDHQFSPFAVYWLTWESDATTSPLPGAPRRVAVTAAPALGGQEVAMGRTRLHRERQVFDEVGWVEDNWTWDNAVKETSMPAQTFALREAVPDSAADFSMDVRGKWYSFSELHTFQLAGWLNDDQANRAEINLTRAVQDTTRRVRIRGRSSALVPGLNTFKFYAGSTPAGKTAAFDCFDLFYWARLDIATGGALAFVHPGDQVPGPATAVDFLVTAAPGTVPVVWDVTDAAATAVFTGEDLGGDVHDFGLLRDPVDRRFLAVGPGDYLAVDAGWRVRPTSLRGAVPQVDYLVVYAAGFGIAAADLAAYRATDIPGVTSPAATAVYVGDVYDNYSGGQKDPRAIRNFLRRVYLEGGMRLQAVCLVGNASRDFRNYKERDPASELVDLMPTELRTDFPLTPYPLTDRLGYPSDDGLVSFDDPGPDLLDLPDLAVGRLPASDPGEAEELVDRAIEYDRSPAEGPWRNHLMFTADDCVDFDSWPDPVIGEQAHTRQAEILALNTIPYALDLQKTYGVGYSFPPSSRVKPAMRADINATLSAGTTIFYYVGHGAEDNLADEQIFQSSDIANLGNGMRRPVFVAFSCDVGVFDSPSRLSMAEKFVLARDGGAIGSICASQVSFAPRNDLISTAFFENLYPGRRIDPGQNVGRSLVLGKAEMVAYINRKNSQKYNLMGDPAQRLPHPVDDLAFAAGTPDTMYSGRRMAVLVDQTGGKALVGPGDTYELLAEESAYDHGYVKAYRDSSRGDGTYARVPVWDTFVDRGGPVFRGSGSVGAGQLEIPFMVPAQLRFGDLARLRLVVEGPDGLSSAIRRLPAVRSSIGPGDDVTGPDIAMAFENDRYTVRPGTPLNATLSDTSGIAILGTAPGNSLLLEFDDSGFMLDVTPSFSYDANSYTTGRLSLPLPADLDLGRHTAALHGSDALGNVGSDTLSFEVAPATVAGIERVTLFPNPTPGPCRLIFELSDPMEVQWDIYTTSGRRLKTVRRSFAQAGPRILEWDGRDDQGDEIANGTYLFVLRGLGGAEEGRDITRTGKLVIMR